jgi:hypothetical protein
VTDIPTLLLKDKKQSIAFSLQDIYNNELALDNWSFDITTSDPIILHDIGEKEGTQFSAKFKSNSLSFTPKKTGNITFSVTLTQDKNILKTSVSRPVLSDIKLVTRIDNRDAIEVGQDVPVNFSIERADGTVVDTWDMPITVGVR